MNSWRKTRYIDTEGNRWEGKSDVADEGSEFRARGSGVFTNQRVGRNSRRSSILSGKPFSSTWQFGRATLVDARGNVVGLITSGLKDAAQLNTTGFVAQNFKMAALGIRPASFRSIAERTTVSNTVWGRLSEKCVTND
jgi:hypothetical protein